MNKCTLIVTEKPDAAFRIAFAIDDLAKPKKNFINGVPYYQAQNSGKKLMIVPTLGHLYTVTAKDRTNGQYPVFCYEWLPRNRAERGARRVGVWLKAISTLAKEADEFVDACDYDLEGSIIGFCVLKYACGGKEVEAKRMRYSTLTEEELRKAFRSLYPHLDFNLVNSGLARHEIDWLYGVNLSRALTQAAKTASGRYATLSTGRVQGPTLNFLAARERSISRFTPSPFWTIQAKARVGDAVFSVDYEKGNLTSREQADAVVKACRGKTGVIESMETEVRNQPPPPPFDLGELQSEAYRLFGYQPTSTSHAVQHLYLNALISYPRTSSQKLPPAIGYVDILRSLTKNPEFAAFAEILLAKTKLQPVEGNQIDSAHPAIYPTGKPPKNLNVIEKNVYGLITRRFMAVFDDSTVYEIVKATLDFEGEKFFKNSKRTIAAGWLRFYELYTRHEQSVHPKIAKGQVATLQRVTLKEEHTSPPARFNPASLLRKMEKGNIGTKATRASIALTLYNRGYIKGEKIAVTELGMEVTNALRKFCPTVISVEFTRQLESQMQRVQEGKETGKKLVKDAIDALKPVLEKLKANEQSIGKQLYRTMKEANLKKQPFHRRKSREYSGSYSQFNKSSTKKDR